MPSSAHFPALCLQLELEGAVGDISSQLLPFETLVQRAGKVWKRVEQAKAHGGVKFIPSRGLQNIICTFFLAFPAADSDPLMHLLDWDLAAAAFASSAACTLNY
jgi:hypothetical protein